MALSFLVMTMLSVDGLKIRYETLNAPVTGRSCVLLSLLATCCFLSRTDLFWVTPAVGIWLYRREGGFSSRLLWYLGFSALLVLPHDIQPFHPRQSCADERQGETVLSGRVFSDIRFLLAFR